MKKLLFLINFLAFLCISTTVTAQIEKETGKRYSKPLNDQYDVMTIMLGKDTDGRLEAGMTPEHWANDFIASFNKFVTPNDPSDKITNAEDLKDGLEKSQIVHAQWTGDRNQSEVNSTGWEGASVYPFARGPYKDEKVLVYKGYVILSLECGNPMQDMRNHSENDVVTDIFGDNDYQKEIIKTKEGTTINIFVNAQGGNVTNSGNSEVTAGSSNPFGTYDPYQQPIYQQPPVVQNTGCTNCGGCNNCNTTTTVVDNSGSDAEWEAAYWSKKNYQANVANAVGTWLNFGANALTAGFTIAGYYNQPQWNGTNPNPNNPSPNPTGWQPTDWNW